jgi:hypothetical protein
VSASRELPRSLVAGEEASYRAEDVPVAVELGGGLRVNYLR